MLCLLYIYYNSYTILSLNFYIRAILLWLFNVFKKRKREEKQEKERLEKEKQILMEERRLEEENLRKKGKKVKREETGKRSVSGKTFTNYYFSNKSYLSVECF